jgi:ParB family chromosome partitioning protein
MSLRKIFDNRKDLGITITKDSSSFTLAPEHVIIEPGFNKRDYNSPAAKAHIKKLVEALRRGEDLGLFQVFITPDLKILGRDGHCRWQAIDEARSLGIPVKPIRCVEVSPEMEAKFKKAVILTSNNNLKLQPLERAATYADMIADGAEIKEIAELEGITEVAVRNMLKADKLPAEVKQQINDGKISVTHALSLHKEHGDELAKVIDDALAEQIESSKNSSAAAPLTAEEEQLDIFSSQSNPVQSNKEDWDVMDGLQDKKPSDIKAAGQATKAPTKAAGKQQPKEKKIRVTAKHLGTKIIKGEQAKSVSQLLKTLANKIQEAAANTDQLDMDCVSITIDKELAESIIRASSKM